MKIKIGKNRSVYPYRIKVSNQYENKTNFIEFDLDVPEGNKYLFVEIEGKTVPYPLSEKFEVGAGLSWTAGEHRALVAVSNVEIVDNINKENILFLSDEFILVVDENFINPDDVAGGGLPEPLKILYDDLMSLKNAIEKKLQNGEFDGESAYQIAVRLGFKGTEQEWIDSLRYDHSEEFQQIALQVEQKATDAENAAQSASQAAQSASESKESAAQAAQSAIEGANSAKESANSALEGARSATKAAESAKQSASSASGSAQSAEEAATSAKEGATSASQSANSAKESADSAAQSAESASQGAASAEQAKTYASEALQSKNDAFISAQEAKTAESHAKTSEANSKTSETNSKLSETNAKTSELNAKKSAESIQASAEQIEQNKLDIEDLRNNPVIDETVLEKLAIKEKTQGNPCVISDSADWRLQKLNIYGQSEQASTTGAQLLDPSLFDADKTTYGITYTTNEDGSIKVEGTSTGSANMYLGEYIDIFENGQTYTSNLKQNSYTGGINVTYNDGRHDYYPTVTVDKSTMISIRPYIQVMKNVTKNETIYPMLNKGSSVLPFESYTGGKPSPSPDYPQEIISKEVSEIRVTNGADLSQTITLTEPITLRGITVESGGNVTIDGQQYIADVITEKDGVIGVERNAKQLLFDGSEDEVVSVGEYLGNVTRTTIMIENSSYNVTFSDKFKFINNYDLDEPHFYYWDNVLYLFVPVQLTTSQEFREWLQTNPVDVVYTLETPTFEPLPEEVQAQYKALKSYYPNTVIQTGCWNECEYVADPKLYIDKKLGALNTVQSKLLELESKV